MSFLVLRDGRARTYRPDRRRRDAEPFGAPLDIDQLMRLLEGREVRHSRLKEESEVR